MDKLLIHPYYRRFLVFVVVIAVAIFILSVLMAIKNRPNFEPNQISAPTQF